MSKLFRLINTASALAILSFCLLITAQAGQPRQPAVDGTVRDGLDRPKDGIPDRVIENSIVQALNIESPSQPFEDRGIIEFDASDLPQPVTKATLVLNVFAAKEPYPFNIGVYTYAGDGLMTLADFNAGSLFASFDYSGGSTVTLDVTPFINELIASGKRFAGFNFRFTNPSTIPLNGPFIAFRSLEHPEPASLTATTGSPILLTEENRPGRAVALDSVTFMRDPFPVVTMQNFSQDHRTRVILFALDLDLDPGEAASAISAQAEDSHGNVFPLTIEHLGTVPGYDWITQVNIKLPDELGGAGDVQVSVSLHGKMSNKALITIRH
ncbi:MAG TPA: hypothetical protein VF735_14190 [Pyrinomonadaceae bacterium]|jgi:hypothetical protein